MKARYRVHNSTLIEAPVGVAWSEMRDLAHLVDIIMVANHQAYDVQWDEEGGAASIPNTMQLTLIHESLPSSRTITQEVTGRCDATRVLSYRITQNELGIEEHRASYTLKEITSHPELSLWEWVVEFSVAPEANEQVLVNYFEETVADNVDKVRRHFSDTGRDLSVL
ncbi:SRPBCC family protein [Streptomyces sp. NPDC015492]|uniref:SRPBCC family protein n=1 Tax=Streptomyces sp. NPDC015492 TaxID=3364958 RepID=UPI0036F8F546